jgi:hypothetical protein
MKRIQLCFRSFPGVASVCRPSETTTTPLTITYFIPKGNVAGSINDFSICQDKIAYDRSDIYEITFSCTLSSLLNVLLGMRIECVTQRISNDVDGDHC